jgi:hypothetical protein
VYTDGEGGVDWSGRERGECVPVSGDVGVHVQV